MLTNIWLGCDYLKRLVFQIQTGHRNEHKCGSKKWDTWNRFWKNVEQLEWSMQGEHICRTEDF